MIKLNSLEEMMQEHCSRIYWEIDDIDENVMFMVTKINEQNLSADLERMTRDLLADFIKATTILRSAALDLGEKFAWFMFDPGVERIKLPELETGDIVQLISDLLNEQTVKFNDFIKVLEKKRENNEIDGGMIVLFYESGGNILRDKGEVVNSLRFFANNYERYQYEINSKNTKSN